MTGGQAGCVAEQVVGDLIFVCLAWCSYFCCFCCVWINYTSSTRLHCKESLGKAITKVLKVYWLLEGCLQHS